MDVILPIMFAPLYENSKGHWNRYVNMLSSLTPVCTNPSLSTIHGMVYNAMKLFMEVNPQLFDECSHEYTEQQNNAEAVKANRQAKWDRLTQLAEQMKQNGHASAVRPPQGLNSSKGPTRTDDGDPISMNRLRLEDDRRAERHANSVRG